MSIVAENQIIQRIIKSCSDQGTIVSSQLALFFAKSIILNKQLGFSELTQDSEKIQDLISISTERLTQQDSPSLETIKMQIAIKVGEKEFDKELQQKIKSHHFKSRRISGDIINKSNELEVFGDMVIYILHKTRLLEKSNETIQKETMTALESVIPRDFVNSFMKQSEPDKRNQLHELWKIVWGIKLFNNCSPGNVGHKEEREKLNIFGVQKVRDKLKEMEEEEKEFQEKVDQIINYMEFSDDVSINNRLRVELINRRQYLLFIRYFIELLKISIKQVKQIENDFTTEIQKILDIVTTYSSVEKSKIYPMFINISEFWKESEKGFDNYRKVEYLFHFLSTYKHSYNEKILQLKNVQKIETKKTSDEDETVSESQYLASKDPKHPVRIRTSGSFEKYQLEFNNFDPVSLVSAKRILKKVNPNVDCIKYNDRVYGFSGNSNSNEFYTDPENILKSFYTYIEIEPELIHIFGLEKILPKRIIIVDVSESEDVRSFGSQTGHPLESNIDYDYHFSEWELRKKALKIASLRTKKTHSVQTKKSSFRKDNKTQVYLTQGTGTQTMKERGTNPLKHVRYIKNLRGKKDSKVKVVNLMFDVYNPGDEKNNKKKTKK